MLVRMDRQNNDWNVRPRADALKHLGAFKIGQIQIQDNYIRLADDGSLQPGCRIFGLEHGESVKFEACTQEAPYLRFVVDDKDVSHRLHPPVRGSLASPSADEEIWWCRDWAPCCRSAVCRHLRQQTWRRSKDQDPIPAQTSTVACRGSYVCPIAPSPRPLGRFPDRSPRAQRDHPRNGSSP